MADAGRLIERFKEAWSLTGSERESFVRRLREEDPELGRSLAALLSPGAPEARADDREQESEPATSGSVPHSSTEFTTGVVERLAHRGDTYGRYRLEGEVARGGQGAILRVWDEDLRRDLAMKVILEKGRRPTGETPPADTRSLGRFLEEARVTGQLDHPGIVPVHELGLDDKGQVYFTMKLVQGRDLKLIFDRVREQDEGWTRTRTLGVLLKVCEAMAYAHSKHVIHRDLKPSNVMVGQFGEVYVMDWGLARVLGQEDERDIRIQPQGETTIAASAAHTGAEGVESPLLTMDGDVVGTPAYMSPEQARGDLEAMGPHSDVYAVGAMLYHLLTGQMPYVPPGARLNNYAVWALLQAQAPKPLDELATDVPPELAAICHKAMARDRARRYPDMHALGEDLRAFLENRVVSAYRTGALVELRKWVQRNRALAGALAAGILALVLGLTVSRIQTVRAEENERLAEARRDEVLQLSTLQELEDLTVEARSLWPVHPDRIPEYERWLEDAAALTTPLPDHRAKREQLRARALPRTDSEREAERRSHPEFVELERLEGELVYVRMALAARRDGVEPELPEVDWNALPARPGGLNELAWERVDPEREDFGDEAFALALARRAAEKAPRNPAVLGTLAWASYALGYDDAALDAGFASLEAANERRKPEYEEKLLRLEELVGVAQTEEGLLELENRLATLESERAELDARVDLRLDWRFPEEEREARWWNNQLTKLIEGLEALEAGLLAKASEATAADQGWSIPRRLEAARSLRDGFASDGTWARAWERSLPALAQAYPGLELSPQLGLLPLGPDPRSGLWEFADLLSGDVPERDAEGALAPDEAMGLVFVLLPGGTFPMGAQAGDPAASNYDPDLSVDETPLHDVTLSPFFFSKYELTQGQWQRLTGRTPSYYGPHNYGQNFDREESGASFAHPVERVSWNEGLSTLARFRMNLPSEAQWEYGARGGRPGVWWTGSDPLDLAAAGNLGDDWARKHGGPAQWSYEDWTDGFTVHAPVGSFEANPFGLHDVIGNVAEWCLDSYQARYYAKSPPQDPVASRETARFRVIRGGGFLMRSNQARSAVRAGNTPDSVDTGLGLRPVRALLP